MTPVAILFIGLLGVSSYRPVPAQTKPECKGRFACTTSEGDGITKYGVAVSQDFLKSGEIKYGDALYVEGYGIRIVNDCMNVRHVRSIDLLVFTKEEEKRVGVKRLKVYLIRRVQS